MPFDENLKNSQTPGRAYALCRLLQEKPLLKKKELEGFLQPESLNKKTDVLNDVLLLAKKGGLVEQDHNGRFRQTMEPEELSSMATFRRAIARRIFQQKDHIFCRFTAWYLMRGDKVYSEKRNDLIRSLYQEMGEDGRDLYNETNLNGWRTWAAFLGLGFIHNGVLVPNAAVRLEDVLAEDKELLRNTPLPFGSFINWLSRRCPELDFGEIWRSLGVASRGHRLSPGLSAGLRALHDMGIASLSYVRDAREVWYLARAESHSIPEMVSQIVIKR